MNHAWIALAVVLCVACEGDPSADGGTRPMPDGATTPDASTDAPARVDGGLDAAVDPCGATCVVPGPACGIYQNACGAYVRCDLCAFDESARPFGTTITSFSSVSVAQASDGTIHAAHDGLADGVHVARLQGGEWVDELAIAAESDGPHGPHLAIADDGTRWLAHRAGRGSEEEIVVSRAPSGGEWSSVGRVAAGWPRGIAVGSDGVPHVVYRTPIEGDLVVATWTGSSWVGELVSERGAAEDGAAIVVSGARVMLAFVSFDGVTFAERDGSTWIETVLGRSDGAEIALAVDDGGEPAVVVAGGSESRAYRRSGETWSTMMAALGPGVSLSGSVVARFDVDGRLWAAMGSSAQYLVRFTPLGSPVQRVHRGCRSSVGLARGPSGGIVVLDACLGTGLEAHSLRGPVHAAFRASCEELESAVCSTACALSCGSSCCFSYEGSTGSGRVCTSPASRCLERMQARLCADVTVEAEQIAACRAALPSTACSDGYADLPPACGELY